MTERYFPFSTESGPRAVAVAGSVFLLFLFCLSLPAAAEMKTPVIAAAESFFELRDAGSLQQAWWEGSEILHQTTRMDRWMEDMRIQSELMGDLVKRSLRSRVQRSTMPGLPDGEYVILLYDVSFEHKKAGLEILVMLHDASGDWRLVSYRLS